MGKKWMGKGVERFVNGKVAGREWLPTWAACQVHLLQNAVTSRHHRLLESKSVSAAAAWPTALGTELYGEHQWWLFFTVKFKLVWSSHRFLNHRRTESGVCHLRWALVGSVEMEENVFFYAWKGRAHFPHANDPASERGKQMLLEGWQWCVENVVWLALRLVQSPSVCHRRERGSEPKRGVCGGGGRWGFPFHKSFGVGGVRLKFMSPWGLMQNF